MRKVILIVLMLSLCACTARNTESEQRRAANMRSGDTIVSAIKNYQKVTGKLPQDLEVLRPDYLSDIPRTKLDTAFELYISEAHGFLLCFFDGQLCCYLGNPDLWECSPEGAGTV